jgi:hypothetical protein
MASLPDWIVLASPVVALSSSGVSAAVAAVAIRSNNRNQKEQRELQQRLHQQGLEERSLSTLRDERIEAYSTLARLTKTMALEAPEDPLPAVYEALSQVEILTQDPKLREIGEELVDTWAGAWRSAHGAHLEGASPLESPFDAPGYRNREGLLRGLRNAFVERAKNEIGVGTSSREEVSEGSTPGEALSGP